MKIEYYIETTLLKFLKTKTIDSIRVIDLIDEIGICKGTFYKYYQDKYQLLIRSFQNYYYDDILKGADSWESFVTRSLNSFKSSPSVILNAFNSQDINSLRSYHEQLMRRYFFNGAGVEEGEFYGYSVDVFTHYVTDIIMDWLKSKCAESNAEMIRKMKAIMPVTLSAGLYGDIKGGKNENKKQSAR